MASTDKINAASMNLQQFNAGHFMVNVRWPNILTDQDFQNSRQEIELLRLNFANPDIDFSSSTRYREVWQIWSKAQVDMELMSDVNRSAYFDALESKLQAYDLNVKRTLFDNSRLIYAVDKETKIQQAITLVALYGDHMATANHRAAQYAGDNLPQLSQILEAPKLENTPLGQYEYLKHTLQIQLLAVQSLAECITGATADTRQDLLLVGDGVSYLYDESKKIGKTQKERITLISDQAMERRKVREQQLDGGEYKVMIDDVIGTPRMHEQLHQVVKAFKHQDAMKKWGVTLSQGVLLYGPPGAGKTMAAQALANELGGELWEVQVNEIKAKWMGESERNIQSLFDEAAKKTTPTVMMWDEIDSIIGHSSSSPSDSSGEQSMEAVRGVFKRETARLAERAPNVILVGATNHVDRIDEAILRAGRFDTKIYMGLPGDDERAQLIAGKIAAVISTIGGEGHAVYADDVNVRSIARMTDGWSGADMVEILTRAQRRKAFEEADGLNPGPITQADLEHEINLYKTEK